MAYTRSLTPRLLLLFLASAAVFTQAIPTPRINPDMSSWVFSPKANLMGSDGKPVRRFWDRSILEQANIVDNFEQLHPLLEKLNAGQPITVVALGDSIAANFGGCFYRDEQHRQRHVALAHHSGIKDDCGFSQVMWMRSFMEQINATWPHPDHLLINLAKPASSLRTWSLGECLEEYFPHQADLILLQHLPAVEVVNSTVLEAERVIHRLWLHMETPYPAVVFLNMHPALEPTQSWGQGSTPDKCIRNLGLCAIECPTYFQSQPDPRNLYSESELHTHAVASYYGMSSLSHPALLHALMRDRLPQTVLGVSECQAFGLMYIDAVHPNVYGRLLIADLLVNFLSLAEQHLAASASMQTPGHVPRKYALPRRPIEPDSVTLYRSHCMYSAAKPDADIGGSAASLRTMHMVKTEGWSFVEYDGEAKKYKPGWVATTPGSMLWIELPLSLVAGLPAQGRRVVLGGAGRVSEPGEAVGGAGQRQQVQSTDEDPRWHLKKVTRRLGSQGETALQQSRANRLALAADQERRMDAWSRLEGRQEGGEPWGLPPLRSATRARVLQQQPETFHVHFTYLRSYKHMGKATLTCLEACTCTSNIDGFNGGVHNSMPEIMFIMASYTNPTGRCILEVKVLPETNSGEHKVKVIQVAVGKFLNMTGELHSKVLASRPRV